MEKKSYVRPKTGIVLMQVRNLLESISQGGGSSSGQGADSRKNNSWDED